MFRADLDTKKEELRIVKETAENLENRVSMAQAEVDEVAKLIQACNTESESCREAQKSGLLIADVRHQVVNTEQILTKYHSFNALQALSCIQHATKFQFVLNFESHS